ncbi:MAG: hypothetical protein ACPGSO_03545 [Vicingaceae bacterium]
MKKIIFLIALFAISLPKIYAQQKAVTETGEEVFLYDDGTWKFKNEKNIKKVEVFENKKKFVKNNKSTFLLKSSKLSVGFWINPKIWSFKKAESNEEAEYELQLKGGDLYGMILTEKVEIPLETLKYIALENGKSAAPDLKVVHEEYRNVNGLRVLLLKLNGTMQGIKFSYYGYYYSNENGTVQFITYTAQNLLDGYLKDAEILLNGITDLK